MSATILYVGTSAGLAVYTPGGDGGSWRAVGSALPPGPVVAIVAADAETLLVAVQSAGGQQSFDGGVNWMASAETPQPVGLQVMTRSGPVPLLNPRLSGATAYARLGGKHPLLLAAGAGGMLLFRSSDDGIHWEAARIDGGPVGRIAAIAPDAGSGSSAWAGSDSGTLLRTTDSGRSWQVVARAPAPVLCLSSVASAEDE